ncbi:hypothetical protein [Paracoccus sp. TOH]|uniref:hypothetical protein n=1 Tax=Paracoccus sp. TOH TaxID=1263728 RepID=UPI0025B08A42|nr:hypothetical protein [Paracoccus sp. TOH]WJS87284.1 hypothetical protein NBE95_20610 [Paracoccus sp. TOH]
MTTYRESEEAKIVAGRGGENRPIEMLPAVWDGHRSARIIVGTRDRGLATTAYSYGLTDAEKREVAERIAALWNLAASQGWTTADISRIMASANHKEGKNNDDDLA